MSHLGAFAGILHKKTAVRVRLAGPLRHLDALSKKARELKRSYAMRNGRVAVRNAIRQVGAPQAVAASTSHVEFCLLWGPGSVHRPTLLQKKSCCCIERTNGQ